MSLLQSKKFDFKNRHLQFSQFKKKTYSDHGLDRRLVHAHLGTLQSAHFSSAEGDENELGTLGLVVAGSHAQKGKEALVGSEVLLHVIETAFALGKDFDLVPGAVIAKNSPAIKQKQQQKRKSAIQSQISKLTFFFFSPTHTQTPVSPAIPQTSFPNTRTPPANFPLDSAIRTSWLGSSRRAPRRRHRQSRDHSRRTSPLMVANLTTNRNAKKGLAESTFTLAETELLRS